MKLRIVPLVEVLVVIVGSFLGSAANAQITPLGDSYTNTADLKTNYGSKTVLDVDGATQISYIQFDLNSIPTTASISQATLKLYVNSVTTAGSFNVDYVNGSWSESTIDASNAPALGSTIASDVNITTADKNQYILVNVTSAVEAWLDGSEPNNGIALVANSTFNATFDSKESTSTSHPAELDIAYTSGTITGVTTASGSGLSGGGTSGTLNLSLTNACAANQVLQWSGSAWACASPGTGTITGVTAGTDLTGGGTSGNVTLNLNTSALNSAYAQLAAANTFTGNQTVNGNLSATGVVTGSSLQIGSNLFDYGTYDIGNAFVGFGGNTTTTGYSDTAVGVQALYSNTTGPANTATGSYALYNNTVGDDNTADGTFALFSNVTTYENTAIGTDALESLTSGNANTAVGFIALYATTTASELTCIGYDCGASNALINATAIGAHARVEQSNSLVLGGTGDHAVKVGIGTTKPSNILTIARGAGHPVSDSWETYSSRRWKKNIHPLADALSKVEQLRGVSYDLKDSGKHEIGVIAEEVGQVVPEVVSFEQNGKDATGVDYSRLTALLIEAVKQQQEQIRAEQKQIARLKLQLKTMQVALQRNGRSDSEVRSVEARLTHP
jgi:trimeric autotransporter adhesin